MLDADYEEFASAEYVPPPGGRCRNDIITASLWLFTCLNFVWSLL